MANGKIDEQLELALQVPIDVLEKDSNLSTGYIFDENKWELIIKYSGDIDTILSEIDITIEPLMYGYAIVIIEENLIDRLSLIPEIEYIEKPRKLYFEVNNGRSISCINAVQNNNDIDLYGEGVIVAIIDSGINYRHDDFRNEDGTTRILSIWDQTINGIPPVGFVFGTEYSQNDINKALAAGTTEEQLDIVKTIDVSGHGTHVAGIACGNGRKSNGRYKGVASKSDIIVVKVGDSIGDSFPKTTRIMEALEYVIQKAFELRKPVVINLSFGNNYGSHTGRDIFEQYIDSIASTWKCNICIGAGNEGEDNKHVGDVLIDTVKSIELLIGESQGYVSIQLWKNYKDDFDIELVAPSGESIIINKNIHNTVTYDMDNNLIYVYYGMPTPIAQIQEINIILYPKEVYIEEGIWRINIIPIDIVQGEFDIWLGSDIRLNRGTGFLQPNKYKTLTIPSTAYKGITVGAYNGYTDSYATFSGVGDENYYKLSKPDIVAPGVNITSTAVDGDYEVRTGTSMATPFVTGSVALLMEWGIVKNNDIYLYGEKTKAYIIKGARELSEFDSYPNPLVGWGALCLADSIPRG